MWVITGSNCRYMLKYCRLTIVAIFNGIKTAVQVLERQIQGTSTYPHTYIHKNMHRCSLMYLFAQVLLYQCKWRVITSGVCICVCGCVWECVCLCVCMVYEGMCVCVR